MSAPPRVMAHVHFNAEQGHALLTCSIYQGDHGYQTTTSALTREGVQRLRNDLNTVLAEMIAAEAAQEPAAEVTRPMCRVCQHDCDECVCAIRAATRREAESRLCDVCNSFGRVCCRLHREPVRS